MGKIKKMASLLADKIAAGEVVEKCASVVKELVENAIDANSTSIKIELKEAGIKSIKVTDNGEGMEKDDAKLAFSRHATSKILTEEDLYNINTLGFRGEALASIASVSKVTLFTSTGKVGTKITIVGGKDLKVENSHARRGTTIMIDDLFFNTPARLKYLKNIHTELANTTMLVNKIALANPQIKFVLKNNDKILLQTDGSGDLLKVIMAIYGADITENMLKTSKADDDYEIFGYISKPQITRSNRNHMLTIVNGRVVRNNEINKVINEAYHTFKPDNLFPIVILNIKVDASLIDVNIHPTKQDIKFSKITELKKLIYEMIIAILDKKVTVVPIKELSGKQKTFDFKVAEKVSKDVSNKELSLEDNEKNDNKVPYMEAVASLFGTYIIAQNDLGMYLIDQHAANERINYEKIKNAINDNQDGKALLTPITLEFSNDEYIVLKENFDLLKKLGFMVEEFGINSIVIKEHPTWLPINYEISAIKKLFEMVINKEKDFDLQKFNEKIAIALSCKLSIKANEYISLEEMNQLIDNLRKCQTPYTCPHGRPVIVFFEKYYLEKMFKRSGF